MGKIILGGIFGLAVLLGLWAFSAYNGVIGLDQNVQQTEAQTQNELQRQSDLIPNMVAVVQKFTTFTSDTLVKIADARARVTAVSKLNPLDISNNPDLQKQVIDAQKANTQAMIAINTVTESYPDLKANDQFTALTAELEGSQNRVTVARRNNQLAVQSYNTAVLMFPTKFFGFPSKPYYVAADSAQTAPKVVFTN